MAITPTPKPIYPDVPQTPGVPPVLRRIGQVQNSAVLLVADGLQVASLFNGPEWGLFTSANVPAFSAQLGSPLLNNLLGGLGIAGQSIGDLEYRRDYRISTAPQEQGAFLSYNKVQMPFDGRVTYVVSGLPFARTAFFAQLEAVAASLDLLNLIMPEYQYIGCNVVHHGFRRAAMHGVSMVLCDIWVEQVRVTGTAQFTSTKDASGAAPVNAGNVQPSPVSGGTYAAGFTPRGGE